MKRLERAVANAIARPSYAMPTLRRVVLRSSDQLRQRALDDASIATILRGIVEEVAQSRNLSERSLLTGNPRWFAVVDRVDEWLAIGHEDIRHAISAE